MAKEEKNQVKRNCKIYIAIVVALLLSLIATTVAFLLFKYFNKEVVYLRGADVYFRVTDVLENSSVHLNITNLHEDREHTVRLPIRPTKGREKRQTVITTTTTTEQPLSCTDDREVNYGATLQCRGIAYTTCSKAVLGTGKRRRKRSRDSRSPRILIRVRRDENYASLPPGVHCPPWHGQPLYIYGCNTVYDIICDNYKP